MIIWSSRLNLRLFFHVPFQYSLGRGVILPPPKIFILLRNSIMGRSGKLWKLGASWTAIVQTSGREKLTQIDQRMVLRRNELERESRLTWPSR